MSCDPIQYSARDFKSSEQVKWCPGCGDHSALVQLTKVLAAVGVPREKVVCVSGIGCSSRFPHYLNTYGFHGIHGRAPAIATGVKCANPDLDVWVITGDGDALSIGGNHFLHTIRRNVGLRIILLNNRIYGLTKGQYSPTSEFGTRTKSSPYGTIDQPVHPVSVALGAEVTFVARTMDTDVAHLMQLLTRAAEHQGTAFIEVYQNCAVYNDHAYAFATDRETRADNCIYLEHGQPLIFGKHRDKGIALRDDLPVVVRLADVSPAALCVHDERAVDSSLAYRIARMHYPDFPEPFGVFRCVSRPTYETLMTSQIEAARQKTGGADLSRLFNEGDVWAIG